MNQINTYFVFSFIWNILVLGVEVLSKYFLPNWCPVEKITIQNICVKIYNIVIEGLHCNEDLMIEEWIEVGGKVITSNMWKIEQIKNRSIVCRQFVCLSKTKVWRLWEKRKEFGLCEVNQNAQRKCLQVAEAVCSLQCIGNRGKNILAHRQNIARNSAREGKPALWHTVHCRVPLTLC